ncbi:Malate synthase [Nibea albiflora]|uniref:Malate synthase n=1 Tax=Nibea albiflora TaxID=240163 RepID=A0ACB7ENQ8_NIBAL|nr:Malate synthase [Nibea albiflora]
MELSPPPSGLAAEHETLFTADSLLFLQELISTFDEEVDEVLRLRISRKVHLDLSGDLPSFLESTAHIRRDPSWRVLPVPPRLQRRHVDIGDLAPCDTERFIKALQSLAQGIQVDFDDGNCPTYHNQIKGIHNVLKAVHNQIPSGEHHGGQTVEQDICLDTTEAFEMEEILYELREHSAGLNCGIWDYSASFVNKFGHRQAFLLPDRSKYVNMEKRFLRSYMDLLVQTCHRRGALATGGMAALLLPHDPLSDSHRRVLATVTRLKLLEIEAGVDGFMVYDLNLIEPMQELFKLHTEGDNQLQQLRNDVTVTPDDLLSMPSGGVTLYGLKYNIAVGVLFINAWLSGTFPYCCHTSFGDKMKEKTKLCFASGNGHFFYRGQVEDSATAEISRSQVWQWIRHQTQLEDDSRVVNRRLVTDLTADVMMELSTACRSVRARQKLHTAADIFLEVVLRRDFPEFITTYLNLDHTFLSSQNSGQVEAPDVQRSKL